MSNGIKIPIQATLDDATIAASASALSDKLNRVAQTVAQANKVRFNPIDKATVEDLKKIEAKFVELTRISGGLRQRMQATGQGGSAFADLDWSRLYEDPAIRARKMQQAFRHTTAGTAFSSAGQGGAGAGNGGGGGGGGRTGGGTAAAAAAQVAGAGVRAMGPVGGVVANAAGAGMGGGLGAGVFGLLGGLAALAVGKGVAAVKEKVDAAGQESIGYDTLKRTLGDVNVSFNLLRESLRAASYDVGTTFEETQRLGSDFAKLSGITKVQYKTLADEVAVGGGFGRSFGVDPSQSNQFFAQMRQFGATSNTQDSRKLALMIGEAVTRSGSTTKTDELLQVIASYTANQSRSGLAGANVVGYSGMLSGLVGSGVAGLDPQGAAALLARVNGSIAGGGGAGEAGQNFLYNVLGKRNGLDPVQAMMLQQQGAFGTGRQAFGAGSLYSKFSARFGGSAGGAGGGDETNLAAILASTQRQYAGNPSLMLNATARLLGINENQAMALHTIGPNQLGSMTGRMGRLGLDLSKLNGTGISALAGIESGQDLGAQANALLGNKKNPLSADQASQLRGALAGGDQEKLKDILAELTYTRGQEQTEGSKTRDSIQGVDKRLQELATGLVGPMNDMRNAMVYLAGGGKKSASQINKEMAQIDYEETTGPLKKRREEVQRQLEIAAQFKEGVRGHKWTPAELEQRAQSKAQWLAERGQINAQIDAAGKVRDGAYSDMGSSGHAATPQSSAAGNKKAFEQKYGSAAERAAKKLGVSKSLILAQWGVETGWGKSIVPGTNNLGNIKDFSGGGVSATDNATGSFDRYRQFSSTDDFADSYADLIARKYPGAVNAGSNGAAFTKGLAGYAEDPNYGSKIVGASAGLFSTPMPEGGPATAGGGSGGTGKAEVTITLQYPNGQKAAPPTTVTTKVGAPSPQGK